MCCRSDKHASATETGLLQITDEFPGKNPIELFFHLRVLLTAERARDVNHSSDNARYTVSWAESKKRFRTS